MFFLFASVSLTGYDGNVPIPYASAVEATDSPSVASAILLLFLPATLVGSTDMAHREGLV